jgi:hypothetical protein
MTHSTGHLDAQALSLLLDGRAGADRAGAESHLATCAECSARWAALASAAQAVAGLGPVALRPDEQRVIRQAVLERAAGKAASRQRARLGGGRRAAAPRPAPPPRLPRWAPRWALAAGGAFVVAVLAGTGALIATHQAGRPGPSAASVPRVRPSAALHPPAAAGSAVGPDRAAAPSPLPGLGQPLASPPSLDGPADAAALATAQGHAAAAAQPLTAGSAPAATRQFLASLAGSAAAAPTAFPGMVAASPAQGAAVAPLVPATNAAEAATPLPPAAPGSLAACVQRVLTAVAPPAAPVEAIGVDYQGASAWLVVVATAPAGSGPDPAAPLSATQYFVQTQASCAALAQGPA